MLAGSERLSWVKGWIKETHKQTQVIVGSGTPKEISANIHCSLSSFFLYKPDQITILTECPGKRIKVFSSFYVYKNAVYYSLDNTFQNVTGSWYTDHSSITWLLPPKGMTLLSWCFCTVSSELCFRYLSSNHLVQSWRRQYICSCMSWTNAKERLYWLTDNCWDIDARVWIAIARLYFFRAEIAHNWGKSRQTVCKDAQPKKRTEKGFGLSYLSRFKNCQSWVEKR